jgi:hypothetical protein
MRNSHFDDWKTRETSSATNDLLHLNLHLAVSAFGDFTALVHPFNNKKTIRTSRSNFPKDSHCHQIGNNSIKKHIWWKLDNPLTMKTIVYNSSCYVGVVSKVMSNK